MNYRYYMLDMTKFLLLSGTSVEYHKKICRLYRGTDIGFCKVVAELINRFTVKSPSAVQAMSLSFPPQNQMVLKLSLPRKAKLNIPCFPSHYVHGNKAWIHAEVWNHLYRSCWYSGVWKPDWPIMNPYFSIGNMKPFAPRDTPEMIAVCLCV